MKQSCLKGIILETHPAPRRQFDVLCEKPMFESPLKKRKTRLVVFLFSTMLDVLNYSNNVLWNINLVLRNSSSTE